MVIVQPNVMVTLGDHMVKHYYQVDIDKITVGTNLVMGHIVDQYDVSKKTERAYQVSGSTEKVNIFFFFLF